MKTILVSIIILVSISSLSFSITNDIISKKVNIPFIENKGQVNKNVKFYVNTFYGTTFITIDGKLHYALPKVKNDKTKTIHIEEEFIGNTNISIEGLNKSVSNVNYLLGNNDAHWQKQINTYKTISLGELYPNIEVKLEASHNNVEKLFYVHPKGNINDIKLKFPKARRLKQSNSGKLEAYTKHGLVTFTKPVAYQIINNKKGYVDIQYSIKGNTYGFKTEKYDKNYTLIIDPLLSSTFVGGNSVDEDYEPCIAVDNDGYIYLTGNTFSSESSFPMENATIDGTHNGNADRFVAKFNNDLSSLEAITYIGGSGREAGMGIAIDKENNIVLAGYTSSTNMPMVSGCYDTEPNGALDVYVMKLNNSLTEIIGATYYGGSDDEGFR